jgi:hypothetical protein
MLLPPTLEEIRKLAKEIGLTQREADKFFYYYDANGWKVGKMPMKNVKSAMQGWRLRWEETQEQKKPDYSKGV